MASKREPTFSVNPSWTQPQKDVFNRVQVALPIALGYVGDGIPNLDNHTDKMLVDEVGVIKAALKLFKKAEGAHVERLKARIGEADSMSGDTYIATMRGSKRVLLDQGKCKEVIAQFDEEGISIERLLAACKSGQIQLPQNVFLRDDPVAEANSERNADSFYTTAAGGRSLYVDPIQ